MVHNPSKVYTFRRDDLIAAFEVSFGEESEEEFDAFLMTIRDFALKRKAEETAVVETEMAVGET